MDWKREVLDKLRQYELMEYAAKNIPEEMDRLENESLALRSSMGSTVRGKGGSNRNEDRLINNLVQRQELRRNLEQILWWLNGVKRAMEALDPNEKLILERMYIYPEAYAQQRLCADLGIEQSSLYRKRETALRKLTIAMYGRLES